MTAIQQLKDYQRALRDGFPDALGLRAHRAISWLQRMETVEGDDDAAFIFSWIAFNAAYAADIPAGSVYSERSVFDEYFGKLLDADTNKQIYNALWEQFSGSIRTLLNNQFVFPPFWKNQNGYEGYEDWQERFRASQTAFNNAFANGNSRRVLGMLFDRLYVLRNQLVHGGATWNSSVNRDQVRDGAKILEFLVPVFVTLMMENPDVDWGKPYYPVVEI